MMKNLLFGIFVLLLCSIDFADAASANLTITVTVVPSVSVETTTEGYRITEATVPPESYEVETTDSTVEINVK